MPTFATPVQLAEYMTGDPAGTVPDNAAALLRRASSLVAYAVRGAVYATDAQDLPTDPKLRQAMADAVCAQAEAWIVNDIDPAKGAAQVTGGVQSKGLGPASVTYTPNPAQLAHLNRLAAGDELVGEAWRVLDAAGLLSTNVQSRTGADVFVQPWPYDPITGRSVGKYDDPAFGEAGFVNG